MAGGEGEPIFHQIPHIHWAGVALFLVLGFVAVGAGPAGVAGLIFAVAFLAGILITFRNAIVELRRNGDRLTGRRFALWGQGAPFDIPVTETSNWRVMKKVGQIDVGKPSYTGVAFDHGGRAFEMRLIFADVVGFRALGEIAPDLKPLFKDLSDRG